MVYYNHHITGWYNPKKKIKQLGALFSLLTMVRNNIICSHVLCRETATGKMHDDSFMVGFSSDCHVNFFGVQYHNPKTWSYSRKRPRRVPSKKALPLKTVIKDCHQTSPKVLLK